MHYESYVKRGMPSLSLAYHHQCPYSRPSFLIHDSLSESVQRLIKSRNRRHIICCNYLQIPPSSAAPSAASSVIFQASYYTGILSPFVANFPCQGIMFIHDSIPGPIDRGIEGYVILVKDIVVDVEIYLSYNEPNAH